MFCVLSFKMVTKLQQLQDLESLDLLLFPSSRRENFLMQRLEFFLSTLPTLSPTVSYISLEGQFFFPKYNSTKSALVLRRAGKRNG